VRTDPTRRTRLDEIGFVWEPPTPENKRRGRHKKVLNEALQWPAPPGLLSSSTTSEDAGDGSAEEEDNKMGGGGFDSSSPPPPRVRTAFDPLVGGPTSSDEFSYQLPKWGSLQDDALPSSQFQKPPPVPDWKPPPTFTENNAKSRQRALDIGIITEVDDKDRVIKSKIQAQHPWFNDDFGGEFVFEDVVEALTLYREFHGNFAGLENDEFVVPEPDPTGGGLEGMFDDDDESSSFLDDDDDDDDVFGSVLGSSTPSTPLGGAEEDLIAQEIERMQMMTDLGDGDDGDGGGGGGMANLEPTEEDLLLVQQLEDDFLGLEPTTATTTATIATPQAEDEKTVEKVWPEHLAGMRLGNIARRIREGDLEVKHLPERKAQLDAIEFDWGDPKKFLDVPFDKTMCALFAYYMIRGDLFVYEDFIMPEEEPWPRALSGFELGKAVFRLRAKQNFLEAYYPRKKYMLTMLEFVWFPLDALPLDPDAPPLSWEHEHVQHCGHPLARINDPPYSAIEHVHSVDHPEAKDRYEFSYDLVRDYYENTLGITDIGAFLRERGYDQLADEHEAEYGKPVPRPTTAATTGLGDYDKEEISAAVSSVVEEETFFEDEDDEYDDEELNNEALDDEHFKYDDEDLDDEDALLEEEDDDEDYEEEEEEEAADNDDDAVEDDEAIFENEIL
jgi:hypothetical protein